MRFFHRHHRHSAWFTRFVMNRIGRKLRLDPRQQGKLAALHSKMHELHADLDEVKRDVRSHAEDLFKADKLDRDAALRLTQVPRRAMEDKLPEMIDGFAEFFDSLDTEQRERMRKLWYRHQHRHGMFA